MFVILTSDLSIAGFLWLRENTFQVTKLPIIHLQQGYDAFMIGVEVLRLSCPVEVPEPLKRSPARQS